MSLIDRVHERHHVGRRVRTLARHLAALVPQGASLLDVGCGDGLLDRLLQQARADLRIEGVDVLVRAETHIPVSAFDGRRLPFPDDAFDAVMAVDVLHHAHDPAALLTELARVARGCVVLKDHTRDGLLAGPTLRFMDRVGNARFGVALPCHYWTRSEWARAIERLGWAEDVWTPRVGLYPAPLSWLFDRSLHFVARLVPNEPRG